MEKIKKRLTFKNLVIVSAVLIFAFTVLITSIVGTTTAQSSPSYRVLPAETTAEPNAEPSPEATVSPEPKVDYYLVYPGILPDHLFYPLKMIRDRILLFLTFDPVARAKRLLLFADKRLGAGKALVEGGKTDLGVSTLTKGEKYLEQAIIQAEKASEAGKETTELYETLAKATLKHQEVLSEIVFKVPEKTQSVIKEALKYSQQGYEKVTEVLGKD